MGGEIGCPSADCTLAGMAQKIARLDLGTLRSHGETGADARAIYPKTKISRQHVAFYRDVRHGELSPEGGQ